MWMRCDTCHDETHGTREFLKSIGWLQVDGPSPAVKVTMTCPFCAALAKQARKKNAGDEILTLLGFPML